MEKPKTPRDSSVETRYLVTPVHADSYGIAFGGVVISWIDTVANMVAQRHCEGEAVTVSIDRISFKAPINVGDHVILKASVNYVGSTSMEVGVQVTKENPFTGEQIRTTTAYLTFVALDQHKNPKRAPALQPEIKDEKRRYENARIRVETRMGMFQKLKKDK